MTLVYVGLIGLGFTLLLSGVYNVPYVATVTAILSGNPLPTTTTSSSGSGSGSGSGSNKNNPLPPTKIFST